LSVFQLIFPVSQVLSWCGVGA